MVSRQNVRIKGMICNSPLSSLPLATSLLGSRLGLLGRLSIASIDVGLFLSGLFLRRLRLGLRLRLDLFGTAPLLGLLDLRLDSSRHVVNLRLDLDLLGAALLGLLDNLLSLGLSLDLLLDLGLVLGLLGTGLLHGLLGGSLWFRMLLDLRHSLNLLGAALLLGFLLDGLLLNSLILDLGLGLGLGFGLGLDLLGTASLWLFLDDVLSLRFDLGGLLGAALLLGRLNLGLGSSKLIFSLWLRLDFLGGISGVLGLLCGWSSLVVIIISGSLLAPTTFLGSWGFSSRGGSVAILQVVSHAVRGLVG